MVCYSWFITVSAPFNFSFVKEYFSSEVSLHHKVNAILKRHKLSTFNICEKTKNTAQFHHITLSDKIKSKIEDEV